jgi:hypothetical protein
MEPASAPRTPSCEPGRHPLVTDTPAPRDIGRHLVHDVQESFS